MYKSKLLRVYGTLNVSELRRFNEFVHSPYFNKNIQVTKLNEHIKKCVPNFEHKNLDRKAAFKAVFGNCEYKERKVADVMSYLYQLLIQFLSIEYRSESEYQTAVITGLSQKKLHKDFKTNIKQFIEEIEDKTKEDVQSLHQLYRLEIEFNRHHIMHEPRKYNVHFQDALDYFDQYYLINKLKFLCEVFNREKIINASYEKRFLAEIQSLIANNQDYLSSFPLVQAYSLAINLLTQASDEQYFRFKAYVLEHVTAFPELEAKALFQFAQNYCIRQANAGKSNFLNELFALFEARMNQRLLLDNDVIAESTYKNIVTVGCKTKNFDWTGNFIEQYKKHLSESSRENAYNYNRAYMLVASQQFDQAVSLLNNVEFTDLYYALDARTLLLKAYYAEAEYDPLFSLIDSFGLYLRRNRKLSSQHIKANLNFLKLAKKLANLKLKIKWDSRRKMLKQISDFEQKIENQKMIQNKRWLLDELERLKQVA